MANGQSMVGQFYPSNSKKEDVVLYMWSLSQSDTATAIWFNFLSLWTDLRGLISVGFVYYLCNNKTNLPISSVFSQS